MSAPDPVDALKRIADDLEQLWRPFAVVGGIAVSVRGEVRFARDVDVAVDVRDDSDAEALVRDLRARGYDVLALVEHEEARRLATVRLRSPSGITVDLLTARSGIEADVVARAAPVAVECAGELPVAQAEELLALKVLSMDERRLQDRIDALALLSANPDLDLARVREDLRRIQERGFHRQQDLAGKLSALLGQIVSE